MSLILLRSENLRFTCSRVPTMAVEIRVRRAEVEIADLSDEVYKSKEKRHESLTQESTSNCKLGDKENLPQGELSQTAMIGPGRFKQTMQIREGQPCILGVIKPSSGKNLILLFNKKHKFLSIQEETVGFKT